MLLNTSLCARKYYAHDTLHVKIPFEGKDDETLWNRN